jgi:hypothetical protein
MEELVMLYMLQQGEGCTKPGMNERRQKQQAIGSLT